VQGFGKVGGWAAVGCAERGIPVVAASDVTGAVGNPDGLDVAGLLAHVRETGGVAGFPGGDPVPDLLTAEADVLLPCALEGVITQENAGEIRARLIVEGANGPTTLEADAILESRGVTVVPDILANAGGVVVSYYEWVQNREGFFWEKEEVNGKLLDRITGAYATVRDFAAARGMTLRQAAYCIALDRIARAMDLRGVQ
jgi:glutamate dehydrogenase (NAD(P)+)